MASLGLYWLINAGFVGVVAVKHISVMMRRRQAAQQAVR
jgi:hypothetical protein